MVIKLLQPLILYEDMDHIITYVHLLLVSSYTQGIHCVLRYSLSMYWKLSNVHQWKYSVIIKLIHCSHHELIFYLSNSIMVITDNQASV